MRTNGKENKTGDDGAAYEQKERRHFLSRDCGEINPIGRVSRAFDGPVRIVLDEAEYLNKFGIIILKCSKLRRNLKFLKVI